MSRRWKTEPAFDPTASVRAAPRKGATLGLIHPLLPDLETYEVDVSVILGTYNRRRHLEHCIESVHRACAGMSYEIVVCDGGSTDGSREWLSEQRNVVLVKGKLDGAVKAFNACFDVARGRFILNLNDDADLTRNAVRRGLRHFKDPMVGQVAFGFTLPDGHTQLMDARGVLYANYGLTRANVAHRAASICGGFWATVYHTYGGDTELSMWVRRLGYKVVPDLKAEVRDRHADDGLRKSNNAGNQSGRIFWSRWPTEAETIFRGVQPRVTPPERRALVQVEVGETPKDRWGRLARVDPQVGELPPRARPRPERVIHAWLRTNEDPQQSQHDALKALGAAGHQAIDWTQRCSSLARELVEAARALRPTLVFLQLQGPHIDPQALRALRQGDPSLVVALWSGDVGRTNGPWGGFEDDWSHQVARHADVMLYTGTGQVQMQRARGMQNAAYLQIGFDEARYHAQGGAERAGVVFLGQNYGGQWDVIPDNDAQVRRDLVGAFKAQVPGFTAYGGGWGGSSLAQPKAGDVLRRSLLALSVSLTSKLDRYTSDRMIRSMACGTPTLVKRFGDMEGLGLRDGENVLVWDTVEQAVSIAKEWLRPEKREELLVLGQRGAALMRTQHTWSTRMWELSAILKTLRGQR